MINNQNLDNIINLLKKNKKILMGILVIIVVIILSAIVNTVSEFNKTNDSPTETISFFIKNKDNRYALFNEDGKQLSDFIYTSVNDFYNGVALVKNSDNKKGVINEKGKIIIGFGKYDYLENYGSLFNVREFNQTNSLLDKNGKKIINYETYDVDSFVGVDSFIIVEYADKEYVVYNYEGKKVTTFNISKDEEVEDPSVNEEGRYASVYYDGLTIIFNTNTAKTITKIKEDKHYCINNVSEDEKIIILNSCDSSYENQEAPSYKIIKNNKVYDIDDKCESVSLDNNLLVCQKNNKKYLLDKKLKPIENPVSDMAYQDEKNYALRTDTGTDFIKKGKKVKSLNDVILTDKGFITTGLYLVYQDDEYKYYDSKGKLTIDSSYKSANNFDSNNLAKVSEDNELFYYINTKGKKVSEEFHYSYQNKEYYTLTKNNKKGVMDKKGKMIIDFKYDNVDIRSHKDVYYAYASTKDKYELYNLDKKKVVLTTSSSMAFFDNYIKVSNGESDTYYTYSGKLFYEEA